jgi:hypothetical protein
MYEIIDDNGVIHSGTEKEMEEAFDVMVNPNEYSPEEVGKWSFDWEGDLKLVEVKNVHR